MPTVKCAARQVFFASVARKLKAMLWPNSRNNSKEELLIYHICFPFALIFPSSWSTLFHAHLSKMPQLFYEQKLERKGGREEERERRRKEDIFSQNVNFYE